MFSEFFEVANVIDNNNIQSVDELLTAYGGKSFLNGLYRIHYPNDIVKWTEIICRSFPKYKREITVFGYDWLGRNFALESERNIVLLVEPGTGEMLNTEMNFIDFQSEDLNISGFVNHRTFYS